MTNALQKIAKEAVKAKGFDPQEFLSLPICAQRRLIEEKSGKSVFGELKPPRLLSHEDVERQLDEALRSGGEGGVL